MASDDPAAAVSAAAGSFSRGDAGIVEAWSSLHSHLLDLTRTAPLSGDFLDLFRALERWEGASGEERDGALEEVRSVCSRLSAHT